MKKDKAIADKTQNAETVKKDLPVKTTTTDAVKNVAVQTPGLNQDKTTRDDLFPSGGDNLTK